MLQRISFVSAFIAALSGVLGGKTIQALAANEILPYSAYNREQRRRLRYGNRNRLPGKAQPAGSKRVRIANV